MWPFKRKPDHSDLAKRAEADLKAAGADPATIAVFVELILKFGPIALGAVKALINALRKRS